VVEEEDEEEWVEAPSVGVEVVTAVAVPGVANVAASEQKPGTTARPARTRAADLF